MIRFKLALLGFLVSSACSVAYVPQSLPIPGDGSVQASRSEQAAFELDIKPLTRDVIVSANAVPWQRQAIILDSRAAEGTSLINEATARAERLPPSGSVPTYRLGVGDQLALSFQRQATNSSGVPRAQLDSLTLVVLEDGTIFAADFGSIDVQGKTLATVRGLITDRLMTSSGGGIAGMTILPRPPSDDRPVYQIGVGDVLTITQDLPKFLGDGSVGQELNTRPIVVKSGGSITLLGAGEVNIEGLTVREAADALSSALLRNGLSPDIELSVTANNSKPVRVVGDIPEVGRLIPVTDAPVRLTDIMASLGLRIQEDIDYLIRIQRDGIEYGISQRELFEVSRDERIYVHPDDLIIIEAGVRAPEFAVDIVGFNSQSVAVTGSPGQSALEIPITSDPLNLVDAIRVAGFGVDRQTDAVARIIRGGIEYRVSVRRALLEEPGREIFLQPDDHIILESVVFKQQKIMITGAGTTPRLIDINQIERPTLSDAVFSSGALGDEVSDLKQVFLLRLNDPTKNEIVAYFLDLSDPAGLILANSMQLRPNDIIFISDQPITQFTIVVNQITEALRSGLGLGALLGLL
ncbi:polysaccharide biosynthesis/export family protein [Octadecabacter sp.]|nr:polysaccharide biosynthesis/export family protein [Octadecabacter sp.]